MMDRALLLDAVLADPAEAFLVAREDEIALLIELARVERARELRAVEERDGDVP